MRFDLEDCIKGNDGETYCFDCMVGGYVRIRTEPVNISEIPLDVKDSFLRLRVKRDSGSRVKNECD
jgi:hypothetical protein